MATYTVTKPLVGTGSPSEGSNHPYFMSVVIDFSSQTNVATDVFSALTIAAKSMVIAAGIDILTKDTAGNSSTLDLVDSVNSVTYVAAAAHSSAAGAMTSSDAAAEMFVTYDTADTLDVTIGTGASNALVRVWAIVQDYSNPITAQRVVMA